MDKLIDIHNHLLPSVDDGANNYIDAIKGLEYLKEKGYSDVVLTSHYVYNSNYEVSIEERKKILSNLVEKLNDNNINLYLGNEVYVSDIEILLNQIKSDKICTLNNSKYLLIEFPMHQKIHHLDRLICELNDLDIIPIIAHPERYSYFNLKEFKNLLEYNCLLQCNIGSFSKEYGSKAKKNMKLLLKENMVSILATDFHRISKIDYIGKALKKLEKKYGSDKIKELVYDNPKLILENKNI